MAVTPTTAGAGPKSAAPKPAVVKTSVTGHGATHAAARTQAVQALGKEMTKGAPAKPAQKQGTPAFSPWGTHQQFQDIAQRITGQQSQAQLIPLRQQAAQLANQQQTVSNRYAGYSQTDQGILSGLQSDQAASALTNENAQAQAAQATANQIDQSGKAAAALNAGYQGPEAQAALANTQQFQGGVQGAQAGYLAGQAGNNADLLTALRGTAALQAQQGQRDITSAYAKPIGTNAAAQQAVIAKQPASAAAMTQSLEQTAFQDRAIAKKFNLDQFVAKSARQRAHGAYVLGLGKNVTDATNADTRATVAQTGVANAVTRRMGVKEKINYDQATTAWRNTGLADRRSQNAVTNATAQSVHGEHVRHDHAMEKIAGINTQLRKRGLTDSERATLVTEKQGWKRIANSTAPGSKSATASTKAVALITGGASWYQHSLKENTGAKDKSGAVIPPATIKENLAGTLAKKYEPYGAAGQAAVDLATKGYVTPATVQKLKDQGVTLPASMTTPPKPGQKLPGPLPPYSGSSALTKSITAPIG